MGIFSVFFYIYSSAFLGGMAKTGITQTVSSIAGVAKTGVSSVAKTTVSQNIGVSFGLPLGDVNDSSRVGNVASGAGVGTTDSRDGGGGHSSDVHGSRGGDTGVAGGMAKTGVAQTGVSKTMSSVAGVAKTSVSGVAKTGVASVAQEVGVRLSGDGRGQAE